MMIEAGVPRVSLTKGMVAVALVWSKTEEGLRASSTRGIVAAALVWSKTEVGLRASSTTTTALAEGTVSYLVAGSLLAWMLDPGRAHLLAVLVGSTSSLGGLSLALT